MEPSSTSSQAVQQAILQALYALFLGGIITAFLVVGLNTFYPAPAVNQEQIAALDDREAVIYECQASQKCEITSAQEGQLRQIQQQRQGLYDEQEEAQQAWSQTAGLIMIGLASALLALSLIRWDRAIVLSNGLLLGGLFTMVGGIGLTIASGEGVVRFLVLALALALTVGLGYLRFARRAEEVPAPVCWSADAELAGRVAQLEVRLDDVRRALGG